MITCKQVSKALSHQDYDQIHPVKRFFLKLHIIICPICGKFNRQLIESQNMCREFREHEEELGRERPNMDVDKKSKLKILLAQQVSEEQPESKKAS